MGAGRLTPIALVVLTVVFGIVAAGSFAGTRSPAVASGVPDAAVLSPRRVPRVLTRVAADARLQGRLTKLLADASLGAGRERSCLVVRRGDRSLYDRRSGMSLIPASNLKLLTATAAVERLGADTRLGTSLRASAPPVNGVVEGPVWLVGGGDPLLATADYVSTLRNAPQPRTPIEELVNRLAASGVREVRGGVIGDESRYDTVRYIPTWRQSYLAAGEVGPASALVVNDGFETYRGRKDHAAAPAVHAARVLTDFLAAGGIAVGAPPRQGVAPPSALELARLESLPVATLAAEMLRESDNLTAELLVKELGRTAAGAGTTAAGLAVMRETLAASGLPAGDYTSVDGSGLDRSDRATCRVLMATLLRAGYRGWMHDGLAVAGRTGTLSRRFLANPAAGRLRAKTGALEGVAGLTGWMPAVGGPLAFALVANGLPSEATGRALQERLGAVLATYPEAPDSSLLGPAAFAERA